MRGTGLETIPQFLSLNYGKKAEELSSVISSIGILFSAVASCLPGIEIISSLSGLDPMVSSVLLIVMVIGYTFFGGMKSAAVGGIMKMAIIWVSLFVAGFEAFQMLHGTPAWDALPARELDLFGRGFEPSMANLFVFKTPRLSLNERFTTFNEEPFLDSSPFTTVQLKSFCTSEPLAVVQKFRSSGVPSVLRSSNSPLNIRLEPCSNFTSDILSNRTVPLPEPWKNR